MVNYFFDSYAAIEIIKGNSIYSKYSNQEGAITIFNLAEIYWAVLRDFNEIIANNIYEKYKLFVVEIDDEILKEAIKFRIKHKKRDLSYADCIGYIYALKNDLVFLTGDKEFEKLKNVEFVK